jgi:hypothetical protein
LLHDFQDIENIYQASSVAAADIVIGHIMTALRYAFPNALNISFRTIGANIKNSNHPSLP